MKKSFLYRPTQGECYGKLTAVCDTGKTTANGTPIFTWECECGTRIDRSTQSVIRKYQRDCGCGTRREARPASKMAIFYNGESHTANEWARIYGARPAVIYGLHYAHKPLDEALVIRQHPETLCWECANATGGCSWSQRFRPVPGWDATPTVLHQDGVVRKITSYHVKACPEFVEDR